MISKTVDASKAVNSKHPRAFTTALWLMVPTVTFFGLSNLLPIGLIGDDAVTYINGLGFLWSGEGFLVYASSLVEELNTGNHVLPLGAVATAGYVWIATLISKTPLGLEYSWSFLRVCVILLSIWAAAFATTTWTRRKIHVDDKQGFSFLLNYALISALALSTIQIHALWSHDPVTSYPIASWFTVTVGFILMGLIPIALSSNGWVFYVWLVVIILISILSIFLYEMAIASIAAGLVLLALLMVKRDTARSTRIRVVLTGLSLGTGGIVFGVTQFWRITRPQTYDGTQIGYTDLILPVWKTAMMGNLPMANFQRTQDSIAELQFFWIAGLRVGFAVFILLVVAYLVFWKRSHSSSQASVPIFESLVWIIGLIIYASLTALMFSFSRKYQVDIGMTIGNVYLNYAAGFLALATAISVIIRMLIQVNCKTTILASLIVIPTLATIQASTNENSALILEESFAWTQDLLKTLDNPSTKEFRCAALEPALSLRNPDWYRNGISNGMSKAFFGRYLDRFCDGSESPYIMIPKL